jgi:hypothetical protein
VTAAQILRTIRSVPFQPFFVHLVDGRSLRIAHPELLHLTGGGRIAVVEDADGLPEAIDVLMIVSLRCSSEKA